MTKPLPRRILSGWRGLGVFWLMVALLLGGGAVWLNRLGPTAPAEVAVTPPETPVEAAPAPEATPVMAEPAPPPPAEDPAPAPVAQAVEAEISPAPAAPTPPTTVAESPAPLPVAPAPPPLEPPAAALVPPSPARPIAAPDPALQELGRFGPMPRVGDDGRTSIRTYAGQFDRQDSRPRIGIIVADIGISTTQTEDAIRRLPPAMTLVISPYAPRPAQVAERLRARGVESLIGLPLEPAGYPLNDPGNRALLTGRTLAENNESLEWLLARFPAYVGAIGVVGGMRGERFAAFEQGFLALQETLRSRGVLFIDARPGVAAPSRAWGRAVDVVVDEPATRSEIERRLAEVEAIAKARGSALGLAHAATPLVVDRLVAWAAGLDQRGLVLAPVTALARRPAEPQTESRPQ